MNSENLNTIRYATFNATYNATWFASWDAVCSGDPRANVTWAETFDAIVRKSWTIPRDVTNNAAMDFLNEL